MKEIKDITTDNLQINKENDVQFTLFINSVDHNEDRSDAFTLSIVIDDDSIVESHEFELDECVDLIQITPKDLKINIFDVLNKAEGGRIESKKITEVIADTIINNISASLELEADDDEIKVILTLGENHANTAIIKKADIAWVLA